MPWDTHGAQSSQCGRKERREGASSLSAEVTGYLLYGKQNEIRFVLENPPTRRDDLSQLAHTSGAGPEGCPGASFPVRKTGCSLLPSPRGGTGSAGRFGVTNIAAVFLAAWSPDFRGNRNLPREEPSGAERSSLRLPS